MNTERRKFLTRTGWMLGAVLTVTCLCGDLFADETDDVVDRVNRQGLLLLQRCYETTKGENVLVSPYSIDSACSLLVKDASDESVRGLRDALGLPADAADRYAAWAKELGDSNGVRIRQSNVLAVDKRVSVRPELATAFAAFPSASLLTVDFRQPGEAARGINRQIVADTRGEIGPIPLPQVWPDDTKQALVNAFFFDAKWASPFRRNETRKGRFFRTDGSDTPVDMMHGEKKVRFYADERIGAIAIPYRDPRYAFVVAMPRDGNGRASRAAVQNVLTNLVGQGVRRILGSPTRKIEVELPRTGIETWQDLRTVLPDMGLWSMGQWARLELDEEGTRVKVVTMAKCTLGGPMRFRVNSPFVFMVCDSATGLILAAGVIGDPKPLAAKTSESGLWALAGLLLALVLVAGYAIRCEWKFRRNPPEDSASEAPRERSSRVLRILLWWIGSIMAVLLLPLTMGVLQLFVNAFVLAWTAVASGPVAYGLSFLTYLVPIALRACCRSPKARRILLVAILVSLAVNFCFGTFQCMVACGD